MDIQSKLDNLDDYIPPTWLRNSHLMTIVPSLLSRNFSIHNITNEALLIPVDEESMVLARAHINKTISRCLIIVHGLEGSSESPYVLRLATQALALGFNVIRLNLRNCGNTLHLTPTLYNAGQSGDLLKVINWLKQKKGQTEQYVIGYSLGGNLVLKALAEFIDDHHLVGACAISPSIDLSASVDCMEVGINRIYEYYFLRSLRKKILIKHKFFPKRYDLNRLSKVNSLRSFDDQFTAPDAGYRNAAHYYQEASAMSLVNKIKTKTLIIAAQNDSLVPFKSFASINNPYVQLLAPKFGGHVSFIAGGNGKQNVFWAESQILSFCSKQSQIKESLINV